MKKIPIILFALLCTIKANAQIESIGIIKPGASITNTHAFDLYYMPKGKVIKLLNFQTKAEMDSMRVEKYKALTSNYQERIYLSDSTIALKTLEADFWHQKLLQNDTELEQQRIEYIKLQDDKNRIARSRIYYFIAGVLATSVVYVVVK